MFNKIKLPFTSTENRNENIAVLEKIMYEIGLVADDGNGVCDIFLERVDEDTLVLKMSHTPMSRTEEMNIEGAHPDDQVNVTELHIFKGDSGKILRTLHKRITEEFHGLSVEVTSFIEVNLKNLNE